MQLEWMIRDIKEEEQEKLAKLLADKDKMIEAKDKFLASKDKVIADKDKVIAESAQEMIKTIRKLQEMGMSDEVIADITSLDISKVEETRIK